MLFGAQTTEADVHLKGFVKDVLSHRVSDLAAVEMLEEASALAGLPVRDVDAAIWELRARGSASPIR